MTIDEKYKNNSMSHFERKVYEHQEEKVARLRIELKLLQRLLDTRRDRVEN